MKVLTGPIGHFYTTRSPRERRMLRLATLVVAIAVLWSLADWTRGEHSRLTRELPHARAQLEQMQDDAAELLRLERLPAPLDIPLAARAAAARAGAASRDLRVTLELSGAGLRVDGSGAFEALLDWLASMHIDQQMRPSRFAMESQDGQVRFDAVLVPATAP